MRRGAVAAGAAGRPSARRRRPRVSGHGVDRHRPNGPRRNCSSTNRRISTTFRAHEHEVLTTYGWTDKNAGVVRIPIERAKDLLLERGLPVRGADAAKDVKAVKEVKK